MMSRMTFILVVMTLVKITSYTTKVNYIKRKCGSTIMISTAERIILDYGDDPMEEDCQLKLQAYDPYNNFDNINLHLRFLDLELSCSQAVIIIDKFDTSNEIYGANRQFMHSGIGETICGDEVPEKIYESNLKKMSINFHKRVPSIDDAYVDILVTKVNNGLCDQDKEFECDNGRCVDYSLTCDDYYNCDDESDEYMECFWTPGAITGVTIGLIVLISLIVLAVIFIRRKKKNGTFFTKKPKKPIATIHSNDQPYFKSSTSSLAKQLTPVSPVYAPSLAPSMTPNLTPESQRRTMGSTFQYTNGPQRDFGLKKQQSHDNKFDKSEIQSIDESDSKHSCDSYDKIDDTRDPRDSPRDRHDSPRKSRDSRDRGNDSPGDGSSHRSRYDRRYDSPRKSLERHDSPHGSRDRRYDSSRDGGNEGPQESRGRDYDHPRDSRGRHGSPDGSRDRPYDSSHNRSNDSPQESGYRADDRTHESRDRHRNGDTRRSSDSRRRSREYPHHGRGRKISDYKSGSGSRRSSASNQSVNKSPSVNTDV